MTRHTASSSNTLRPIAAALIALALFVAPQLALPGPAAAHSIYIFAWVDGQNICTESYFTIKNKVRGGEVSMADSLGTILATGKTDRDGLYCFPLPDRKSDLEFTVLAGPGHKGTFQLSAAELGGADLPDAEASVSSEAPTPAVNEQTESAAPERSGAFAADEAALRNIVREELQKQLSPVLQALAGERADKTPGVREIVGGIGWLAGLGALGFWLAQRKRKRA